MKTIAIDARELNQTGTGTYLKRLLENLQQIDHSNKYTVLLRPKDIDGWEPTNKNFTKLACPYKEFTFGEQLGFLKQLKDLKPNLIHFAMVQQPIFLRGKNVTTMHDLTTVRFRNPDKNWLIFTIKQQVYKWVNRIVAHTSEAIITPTEYVKDDVAKFAHTNSRKITVTPEAADKISDTAEPVEGISENDQFIMYVGRPTPHKNLERLIEAFNLLKKDNRNLKLVLAGKKDANYKRVEKKVQDNMTADVLFTGFVTEGQLRWLYEHTAVYAFPSLSEGFGLPGLEAMVHGAPVASSNATCLPEVYGDAAEYFDPMDVEEIAAALNKVMTNKARADKLRELGKKQAAKYSWKRMAEQTLAVYKEVLGD